MSPPLWSWGVDYEEALCFRGSGGHIKELPKEATEEV